MGKRLHVADMLLGKDGDVRTSAKPTAMRDPDDICSELKDAGKHTTMRRNLYGSHTVLEDARARAKRRSKA